MNTLTAIRPGDRENEEPEPNAGPILAVDVVLPALFDLLRFNRGFGGVFVRLFSRLGSALAGDERAALAGDPREDVLQNTERAYDGAVDSSDEQGRDEGRDGGGDPSSGENRRDELDLFEPRERFGNLAVEVEEERRNRQEHGAREQNAQAA